MPDGELDRLAVGPIHDRIGPIFDPAFLKLIPKEIMKEIVVARATAIRDAAKAELAAAEAIVKSVEKMRL